MKFDDIYQNLSPRARIALLHTNKVKAIYDKELRLLFRDIKRVEDKSEMGIVFQAFEELLDWMLGNYRIMARGINKHIKVDGEGNIECDTFVPVTVTELREAHRRWEQEQSEKTPSSLVGLDGAPLTGEPN